MEPTPNSTSPSSNAAFIGIDPSDTEELSIGVAKFKGRVLRAGLWDVLTAGDTKMYQDSQRKAIAKLAASGRDPNELFDPADKESTLTLLDVETTSAPEYILARTQSMLEVIRFGLAGHENVATKNGTVPFETEEVEMAGMKFPALTKKTLAFYEVNRVLREPVYMLILRLNTLGILAKKA